MASSSAFNMARRSSSHLKGGNGHPSWSISHHSGGIHSWPPVTALLSSHCFLIASLKSSSASFQTSSTKALMSHEVYILSLIHISEPTRLGMISYAVFCLKKKTK